MKKLLSIILSLVMLLSVMPVFEITAFADELTTGSCGDNVTYSFDSTTGTLTISGTGAMTDYTYSNHSPFYNNSDIITISIDNSVTSIGNYAFYYCTGLTSLTIGNNITKIGSYAFNYCEELTSVTIPNSVTSIGSFAFDHCNSLTDIVIGDSVKSINYNIFYYCPSLSNITVSSGNTVYDSRNNCNAIIKTATSELVIGCKNTSIPNSITRIGDYAFLFRESLTSINVPDSVTSIGMNAFYKCTALIGLTIGSGVTSIGEDAFTLCSALTNITVSSGNATFDSRDDCNAIINTTTNELMLGCNSTIIPNSVTSIGVNAFNQCEHLTTVFIPNSVTNIDGYAFNNCVGITELTIGNSVASIDVNAFYKCSSLANIAVNSGNTIYDSRNDCNAIVKTSTNELILGCNNTIIPDSVTSIGDYAFYYCESLTNVTVPDSVISIGNYSFNNCTALSNLTIGDNVTSIGNYAYTDCGSLENLIIGNSVTSIGSYAFRGCSGLESIIVNSGNTIYDSRNDCNAIINKSTNELILGCKNTNIPNDVTSIGNYAFYYCEGLSSVIIPNSVLSIGNYAFYHCSELSSLTIGDGVTSIGDYAYTECTALTSLSMGCNVTTIGEHAFRSCESLENVIIPNSVDSIGGSAFRNCTALTSVVIPKSTQTLGWAAFYNCFSLTEVTICNYDCSIYNSDAVFPINTVIKACSGSSAETYATTYSRTFEAIGHQYEESERVEPTFSTNGYSRTTCSVCGNEKTQPLIMYKTVDDGTRFASNSYVLPVAKSFVYNGKLYARFDKPIADFTGLYSTYFRFGELSNQNMLNFYRELVTGGNRTWYLVGGVKSGNDWVHKYSGGVIDPSLLQWADGEPNNTDGVEDQIAIIRTSGLLNDSSQTYSTTAMGFIACTDLEELNSQIRESTYYKTNKYVFYNNTMPCSYASLICDSQGGHLATVADSQENTVINNLTQMDVVIGGIRNSGGNFEWVTGEPFTYTNWSSGEPNNSPNYGGQYYMNMYASGLWDDDVDKSTSNTKSNNGFVCEYEPTSLSVRIDQDSTHSVADSEIHILANYPDETSNDITSIATFTKAYVDGCCRISASATKPNGEVIKCTQDIPVEGEHTYVQQTVTSATCTKDGKVANICSICKSRYDEVVPATGHSYTVSKRFEPTCTESGYVQYTCSVCGDKYRETLDSLGHSYDGEPETVEATCTADGTITYTCSRCGETQVETIESQGHRYVISETVETTCTLSGYKTYTCSVCGVTYNETTEAAAGHSYVSNTISPTCTERGYTEYTCSVCGVSYQSNYTDALGHNFETYVFNNDATDLFDGTETAQCTRCDATDTRNVETTTVYSDSISAVAGSEISVPVRIKNNSGAMGFALEFEYDSTVLTPVSVEKGSLITSGLDDNLLGDAVPGKFKVVWYSTENLTDNGILLYLNFTVSDRASGNTTIGVNYIQDDTFNESFEDVVLTCEDIDISITNSSSATWYQGTLTPSTNEVTAGATFCVSIDGNGSSSELTNASHTISFDNTAFTFLGYANANQHLVQTSLVSSTGEITLITNNGHTYNVRTPGEVFDTIGIKYLLFKANDYANSGTYSFGYSISGTTVFENVSAVGCNIKINASATSEVANIYIENGLSGEYTDTVTVPVYISNNKGVMGYMINFEYNPDELEIVLAQRGSSFPGNFNDTIGIDDEGTFSVLWSGNDAVTADGILMNLTFRVLTDEYVVSPITITYSQDDTFNSDYDDVVFNCISGSIHLNEEESHQFIDEVVAPTPNSKGYTKHTCTNCGYSYTDNETDYANDMSALEAALEKVTGYDSADYSTSSYQQLQSVYSSYLDYPNRSIPQTTIDNATSEILTAISNLVPYLYLTVTGENGTVSVSGFEQADKYSVLFGETITLTATADEGYVFDGWYETVTKRIRSNDETFSFKITSNTDFEARFIKEQSATLTFANESGWVAGKVSKTVSEWAEVTTIEDLLPNVPYKLGYTNGRWVYDNAAVLQKLQNGENVTVTPEYDETDYKNPVIPTPLGDEPALDLYYQLDADNNIGSFTMASGFPNDCQVESIGIAFYYKKASAFNPTNFDLNINNKMTTSKFEASNEDGIYTVDVKKFTSYYNWSARGYVTYYDKDGNLKVAYSNQINIIDREKLG